MAGLSLLASSILLIGPARAGAVGQLGYAACISNDGSKGCADIPGNGIPLSGSEATAISPDGRSLYVAAFGADAVTTFDRSPTGQLTYAGCITDGGANPLCTNIPGNGTLLDGADAVAVSPDGRSVYVGALEEGAIDVFSRTPEGRLAYTSCLSNDGSGGLCVDLPGFPLVGPNSIAISGNGGSVYVAAQSVGVTLFNAGNGGQLAFAQCFSDDGSGGVCEDVPGSGTPLREANAVGISPDGNLLYVGGAHGLTVFVRFQSGGRLAFFECLANDGSNGCTDLPGTPLTGLSALAVSPDGASVYTVGSVGSSPTTPVTEFDRTLSGGLAFGECVSDDGSNGLCTEIPGTAALLGHALGLAVSNDGESIYVAADAVLHLKQAAGKLSFAGCISNDGSGGQCAPVPAGGTPLTRAQSIELSPDGRSAYVTGFESTLTQLTRKTLPETTIDSGPLEGAKADSRPKFSFSADQPGASFECATDTAPFAPCAAPTILGPLGFGAHRFAVRAITDGDVDPTPATRSFTVEPGPAGAGAPTVRLTRHPRRRMKTPRRRVTVTFAFVSNDPGSHFLCRLDKRRFAPCRSPKRYRVGVGKHRFAVEAIGAGGTASSPASQSFRVRRRRAR